jgi:DNA end-binding protein Ku
LPERKSRRRSHRAEPAEKTARRGRGLWSGTLTFGLVSVPVDLYPAIRPRSASLRIVDDGGTPLKRQYWCPREERPIDRDEIVRGYEIEPDRYVVVTDEELEALAPVKSREIDLRRFVDASQLDPFYFDRAYFLVPARGGDKAYRLLATTMEEDGRAGIATFVMREKEYLVAILAEDGILRAETLRYADELRAPKDLGLPAFQRPSQALVQKLARQISKRAAKKLDRNELADRYAERLLAAVERKRKAGKDVVEAPAEVEEKESAQIIDLMAVLKRSLGEAGVGARKAPRRAQGNGGRRAATSPQTRTRGTTKRSSQAASSKKTPSRGRRAPAGSRSRTADR